MSRNSFSVKYECPIMDESPEMIVESRPCDSALARTWCVHETYFNEQGKRGTSNIARNIAPVAARAKPRGSTGVKSFL